MVRGSILIHQTGKFCLFNGLQDEWRISVGKSDEEKDIFLKVFAENRQDRIENVFLRTSETDQCGLDDEADGIQFLQL
jgi:hypothetical protein